MAFTVYRLTNSITGKQYIGQAANLIRRLRQHKSGTHCRALASAIKKYGWASFDVDILAYAVSVEAVDLLEIRYIKEFGTLAPGGYNLATGGRVPRGISSETRRRKSIAAKRVGISQACRDASNTPECRARKSIAAKKRGVSQACRDAQKKAVTGRKQSPKHIANRAAAVIGQKRPKFVKTMKMFYADDENRRKHSERMKRWWAERKAACSK